jgi:hypothetical protein
MNHMCIQVFQIWIPSGELQLVLSFPSFGLLMVVPYTYFHPNFASHVWKPVSNPSPSPLPLASACGLVSRRSLLPDGSFVHALPIPRTRPPLYCSALVYHLWERRGRSSTRWLWSSFSSRKRPWSSFSSSLRPYFVHCHHSHLQYCFSPNQHTEGRLL